MPPNESTAEAHRLNDAAAIGVNGAKNGQATAEKQTFSNVDPTNEF